MAEARSAPLSLREVSGRSLVFGIVGKRVFAFDSACPHKGGPLAQGHLSGRKIRCPWHEYEFDVFSGRVASVPYPAWYGKWRETGNLQVYRTKISCGIIYVDA